MNNLLHLWKHSPSPIMLSFTSCQLLEQELKTLLLTPLPLFPTGWGVSGAYTSCGVRWRGDSRPRRQARGPARGQGQGKTNRQTDIIYNYWSQFLVVCLCVCIWGGRSEGCHFLCFSKAWMKALNRLNFEIILYYCVPTGIRTFIYYSILYYWILKSYCITAL